MIWKEFMDSKIKEAIFRQVEQEPFAKKFDLKLVDLDDGYSKVAMVYTPDMENMFGKAHGGALFALIDEAFETAGNSHGTMAVALNMNISYLASPSTGAALTAEAKEINRTNKTHETNRFQMQFVIVNTVNSFILCNNAGAKGSSPHHTLGFRRIDSASTKGTLNWRVPCPSDCKEPHHTGPA